MVFSGGGAGLSALRENCAFLYAPVGAWVRATLGALPLRPCQGTEFPARCSIVALRPIGRIARFAPHLQVAVSATGRAPFRCLPVLAQNYAAKLARPRYARTLRDSFVCCGAWVRGTLGALPRENHGDRRDKAAQIFRARQGVKAKAYWRYVEPQTTRHCAKRQAVLARSPPRFSRPRQGGEISTPSGFHSEPCGYASSSALCANIARFFYAAAGRMGLGYVRGFAPKTPPGN